jgi:predicted nucleotidyltransferase
MWRWARTGSSVSGASHIPGTWALEGLFKAHMFAEVEAGRGMKVKKIDIPQEEIAAFCRRHRIRRLAFFGSVLRDDFTSGSDVDVLVEFEPDARVGLIGFAGMENELSRLIGRKADLNTPGFLSPYFRDQVLREMEVAYEQA